MRIMFALILVAGLGLAGFAVFMAQERFSEYQSLVDEQNEALSRNVEIVEVFVAVEALRYGQRLRKEDVKLVRWPKKGVPEGAFTHPGDLFSEDEDDLRTVLRAMEKDEAIMAVKVTEPGEDAGVSSRLAKGMRAFTVRVDVASGVSGFLRPGDHVDVYWTGEVTGREVTKLILDGIRLIAVDQIADEDRNSPVIARTVTVEVSPQVVAALAQAQATGRLLLSLRGAEDDGSSGVVQIDQNQLLGIETQETVEVVEEQICTIKTRKGGEVVEIPIQCPE